MFKGVNRLRNKILVILYMKGKARRISKRSKRGKRTSKRLTKRGKRTSKRRVSKRNSKRHVSKRNSKRGKRLTLGRFERDDGIMIGGGRWKERAKKGAQKEEA